MRRLNAISGSRRSADSSAPPTSRRRFPLLGFARDRAGVSAIEFAMIAPVLILLIVETLQAGFYLYTSASLNHATQYAARQVLVGAVEQQGLTAAQFRTQVLCPQLPGTMSCNNVITNVVNVPEATSPNGFYAFVNANQTGVTPPTMDNNQTSFCPGSTGSYIYIQVYYAMPLISPIWLAAGSTNWNGSSVHFVSSYAAFKNEPFSGSQSSC
ncbi:MAG: pilus assembly protein [Pseudolabrys sp.]|nr:pilus assembly protein [Pseudolabrys sp.]